MGIEQDCVSCDPKLFVGQLPLDVSADDLTPVFSKYGEVDKVDVLGNGSAMIWMGRWTDAERALEAAEAGELKLGGKRKAVVRIADPPRRGFHLAGIKPKKLFIGQVPRNVVEDELRALFQQFGTIVEFEMPQLRQSGQGRGGFSNTGCAFVRFRKWAEAEHAIAQLHERHQFPESRRPLVVKFADAKPVDYKARSMGVLGGKRPLSPDIADKMCKRMGPVESLGINMAMGLVTMNSNTMACGLGDPLSLGFLASQMGPPMGANSMCGMGRMGMHNGYTPSMTRKIPTGPASMDLDNCPPSRMMELQIGALAKHDPPKLSGPAYCDGHSQYLNGYMETPNGMGRLGIGMGPGVRDYDDRVMNEMCMNSMASAAPFGNRKWSCGSGPEHLFSNGSPLNDPHCQLGRGCPDEAREHTLFVGQIPHEAHELDLWHLFSKVGEILELNILRKDGKSRGSAFVTYSCVEMANEAIEKIDGTPIPWDLTGRKLAVRFKENHSQRKNSKAE